MRRILSILLVLPFAAYDRTRPDSDGRFRFGSVIPGDYRVYAWEEVQSLAWQNADYLDRYRGLGEPVHVGENGRVSVEVRVIPAGR